SWSSQPDVCRCCLSASGTWDITASYITEAGSKEIFYEMIQECFGISMSYLTEWGPSRMVCDLCVGHLRDACSFRKQVEEAERHFVTFCSSRKDIFNPVTIKTESDDEPASPNCDDNIEDFSKAELSKKNVPKLEVDMVQNEVDDCSRVSEMGDNENCTVNVGLFQTKIQNEGKQISERKRVMLTCDIVLRGTNACPFRHHKSWFQCFFCQQDFMEINLLRDHMLQTHADIDVEIKKIKRYPRSLQIEISNLECRQCHLSLTDVISMCRHFVDVHKKVIYNECIADYKVNGSPYSCHLCGQQFHVFRTLTTHLNEHYANCICDVCGKSFLNSKRLKVHKRTHENGDFPCTECGKVLKTKTSKANHMESAHSNRIIKCQICLKPMKHYNDRIKHMSEEHNITHKFKCHICSREYNIKHYLATHIRQTHGQKDKTCPECGMAFITNHGLKKHMLKHSGVKPYSCTVCCKSYARSYTLREHMRAHDTDK
ncbi:hypothetical protein HW555_003891, partial [Spodoptera exigua]